MKNRKNHNSLLQQRFTLLMALLLCLFVSGLKYMPEERTVNKTERAMESPDQAILSVAVDAVVPFVLHVADTVFYLISQVFSLEPNIPATASLSAFVPNDLVEILFERIISPQGP